MFANICVQVFATENFRLTHSVSQTEQTYDKLYFMQNATYEQRFSAGKAKPHPHSITNHAFETQSSTRDSWRPSSQTPKSVVLPFGRSEMRQERQLTYSSYYAKIVCPFHPYSWPSHMAFERNNT